MSEVQERIHGLEMEWSVVVPNQTGDDGMQLPRAALNKLVNAYFLNVPSISSGSSAEYWLTNGTRNYIDLGDHYETTTPESVSFLQTAAYDIASERLVRAIFDAGTPVELYANQQPTALDRFEIHKRVLAEPSGASFNKFTAGCHENYAAERTAFRQSNSVPLLDPDKLALLGLHMATRSVFFGVGALQLNGDFIVAQKASCATDDFTENTSTGNAVINMRDEPLADDSKWARLHMILGDANMNPWVTRLKLATTSLVIRLGELGVRTPDLDLNSDLLLTTRSVAVDTSLSRPIRMENKDSLTALEVQNRLMLAAKALARQITLPTEEQWAIDEWERVCAQMSQDPKLVRDRVEWVLKQELLTRFSEKHGLPWDDVRMRQKDRQWDLIDPRGIGMQLREGAWSQWMPPEEMISRCTTEPPERTRAGVRGRFVRAFSGQDEPRVNWLVIKKDATTNCVVIDDPRKSYEPTVEKWILEQEAAELKEAS